MQIKGLIDEDFVNYKLPSMFISACFCDWKCCKEANIPIHICQNQSIADMPNINISAMDIYNRYINNPITKAIVIGGLEPMLQQDEVLELIRCFREQGCNDDIIIYTGYELNEVAPFITQLPKEYSNIILKVGRFIPGQEYHYDDILGVHLCSDNQQGVQLC
jgi:organic radical activating enzyme